MGLEIAAVMDFRQGDMVLGEIFTRLEEFVTPACKPDEGLQPVVQVWDVYRTWNKQWRVIFSDAIYYQEAVLAPAMVGEAQNLLKNGSIVRLLEFSLYGCPQHELVMKRLLKVDRLEVLFADFRLIGHPCRLNWEEVREDDWDEDDWTWLDPEEEEYGEEDAPCGFRDLTEAITPHAVRDINTNRNAEFHHIILQVITSTVA